MQGEVLASVSNLIALTKLLAHSMRGPVFGGLETELYSQSQRGKTDSYCEFGLFF